MRQALEGNFYGRVLAVRVCPKNEKGMWIQECLSFIRKSSRIKTSIRFIQVGERDLCYIMHCDIVQLITYFEVEVSE